MGKLSSFLCQLSPPRDSLSSLHNSLLKSEPWLSQKLKMFYFCPLIWNHVLQVIQQGLHPGNKGLFPNIVWGLSSNVPLRPLTLFPRLTSVTHRHHKAQFTKGTSKVGSTPKDENQRDKKVVVQGSRSSGPKFPASRCLELSPWNGAPLWASVFSSEWWEDWTRCSATIPSSLLIPWPCDHYTCYNSPISTGLHFPKCGTQTACIRRSQGVCLKCRFPGLHAGLLTQNWGTGKAGRNLL